MFCPGSSWTPCRGSLWTLWEMGGCDGAGSIRGRCGGSRGSGGPRGSPEPRGVQELGLGPAGPLPGRRPRSPRPPLEAGSYEAQPDLGRRRGRDRSPTQASGSAGVATPVHAPSTPPLSPSGGPTSRRFRPSGASWPVEDSSSTSRTSDPTTRSSGSKRRCPMSAGKPTSPIGGCETDPMSRSSISSTITRGPSWPPTWCASPTFPTWWTPLKMPLPSGAIRPRC